MPMANWYVTSLLTTGLVYQLQTIIVTVIVMHYVCLHTVHDDVICSERKSTYTYTCIYDWYVGMASCTIICMHLHWESFCKMYHA